MGVLERIANTLMVRQQTAEQQAIDDWRSMVVRLADDREADESAVVQLLEKTGRSVEDLTAAVSLLRQRRAWADQLQQAEALSARLKKVEADHAKFAEAHRQACEAANAKDVAMLGEANALRVQIGQMKGDAERQLLDTAPQEVQDRIADNREQIRAIIARLQSITMELDPDSAEMNAATQLARLERALSEEQERDYPRKEHVAELIDKIEGHKLRRLAPLQQQRGELQSRVDALNAEFAELSRQRLTP